MLKGSSNGLSRQQGLWTRICWRHKGSVVLVLWPQTSACQASFAYMCVHTQGTTWQASRLLLLLIPPPLPPLPHPTPGSLAALPLPPPPSALNLDTTTLCGLVSGVSNTCGRGDGPADAALDAWAARTVHWRVSVGRRAGQ